MSALPADADPRGAWLAALWRTPDARHGWQLLAATVLSYGTSAALGLPESLWAVMSALIVVRPTTGSSLGVGWQRVQGTVLGALGALGGVALHQHGGLAAPAAALAIVGALAFGSALLPALRSAPIAALVVLGGAAVAGHSALQIALLRVAEISVGVGIGLLVSLFGGGARAATRFDADCGAILRRLARGADALLVGDPRTPAAREADADAARSALRELAVLAEGADREARWLRRGSRAASRAGTAPASAAIDTSTSAASDASVARPHRTAARLLARLSHDVAIFGRLAGGPSGESTRLELVDALRHALLTTADQLAGCGTQDLQPLRRCASQAGWTGAAVKLLCQDLIGLSRLRGGSGSI